MAAPSDTISVKSIPAKSFADLVRDGDKHRAMGTAVMLEAAVKAYKEAAGLEPQNPKAFEGMGKALFMLDDYAGAEDAFTKAYALEKSTSNARELAKALIMLGKAEDVRKLFKKIGADPDVALAQATTELMRDGKRVPDELT